MRRRVFLLSLLAVAGGCASAPPKPAAPLVSVDQKMTWILQLEDRRILRVVPPPEPPPDPSQKKKKKAAPAPPPVLPDLERLLTDPDARIRRRAALAVGRVGLTEGVAPLTPLLKDADPDVRQMAAFALGLIGDTSATSWLTTALQDADARVRGRAAEALGLIGNPAPASAVGAMVAGYVKQGAIASLTPDDEQWPKTPEADAVRLGLFALVRLKSWDALSAAVLDPSGRPVSDWWPVAYALQRINDPRAVPALQQLVQGRGRYTRSFAARGLGALKDRASAPLLVRLLSDATGDVALSVSAIRALAQMGATEAVAPLIAQFGRDSVDPNVRLEIITALGTLKAREGLPLVEDALTDDWPTLRAAALRSAAEIDPPHLLMLLSGMDPDPHWVVRAALADVLGTLPPEVATERLRALLNDADKRVVPAALDALAKLRVPDVDTLLLDALKTPDIGIRTAAADAIGRLKPAGGAAALRAAFTFAQGDATYSARAAVLGALAGYGAPEAGETLHAALADKDWALRVRAAELLHRLDPSVDANRAIRPVPGVPVMPYDSPELLNPTYSPHAFIETAKGTVEIELNVLDAPQTAWNFVTLARKGFFNGLQIHRVVPNFVVQDGDPRGDGSGGPGYTIRDELNDKPYVRGTVGMALEWRDTGGSQFFITHSPQPHLDAKYTVFGRVVNGMDVVDRLQQLDVIQQVRIWDGKETK